MATKVYEVSNPYWLADTFVFSKKHFETTFWGEIDLICYIKVNIYNKIEEIGCNFEKRFRFDFEKYNNVLTRKDVSEASRSHKMRFDAIGNEYWLSFLSKIIKI